MDDLNRFCRFYGIKTKQGRQLRDYFHETRELMKMKACSTDLA